MDKPVLSEAASAHSPSVCRPMDLMLLGELLHRAPIHRRSPSFPSRDGNMGFAARVHSIG